jgi:hypothetical protein
MCDCDLSGPSRSCFHGVPLIVPVPVDDRFKATAEGKSDAGADAAAHASLPAVASAAKQDADMDDVWGAPLWEYLTDHR